MSRRDWDGGEAPFLASHLTFVTGPRGRSESFQDGAAGRGDLGFNVE